MAYMKRAEAQFRKEWASIRPVLMQFRYEIWIAPLITGCSPGAAGEGCT